MYGKPTTSEVKVGNLIMGGQNPVVIQSMTNTDTMDTESTVTQCKRLFDCGCQLVRITAPGLKEARNLENIKNRLRQDGYEGPLAADIHFMPEAALIAARIVEKIRINPGNYCDRKTGKTEFSEQEQAAEHARIAERIAPLLEICKANGTAVRIGVNQGSLSERMIARFGNTPEALAESALEFIAICQEQDFRQIVVSLKSSRVRTMDRSVRLLVGKMRESGLSYPLHLGVTEAGDGEDARLASAVGIGNLLKDGIGNTVRVSLTEPPENEILPARLIVEAAERIREGRTYGHWEGNTWRIPATRKANTFLTENLQNGKGGSGKIEAEYLKTEAAIAVGSRMLEGGPEEPAIVSENPSEKESCKKFLDNLYHAAGLRFQKTRFIACPSCGRTRYDIQSALAKVKARFPDYPNLTLAVMGCIVNGPGEMADADFGYIGCGDGKVNLYKAGQLAKAAVPENSALEELEKLISENWKRQELRNKDMKEA